MLTMKLVWAPGASVPPVKEQSSHEAPFVAVHVSEFVLEFVNVSTIEFGANGRPTAPLEMKPDEGMIRSASGMSNDSWMPAVVELAAQVALTPIPRLAKAAHNSF